MRSDYDVLVREVASSADFDDVRRAFIDGGRNGVCLRVPRGAELDNVEELTLLTRSQAPIRSSTNDALASLGIDDRPGVLDPSGFTGLESLTVWSFARKDLGLLSGTPHLHRLKVEAEGQVLNLAGMENCGSLREAELLAVRAESLAPLRSLRNLLRLWLIGPRGDPELIHSGSGRAL